MPDARTRSSRERKSSGGVDVVGIAHLVGVGVSRGRTSVSHSPRHSSNCAANDASSRQWSASASGRPSRQNCRSSSTVRERSARRCSGGSARTPRAGEDLQRTNAATVATTMAATAPMRTRHPATRAGSRRSSGTSRSDCWGAAAIRHRRAWRMPGLLLHAPGRARCAARRPARRVLRAGARRTGWLKGRGPATCKDPPRPAFAKCTAPMPPRRSILEKGRGTRGAHGRAQGDPWTSSSLQQPLRSSPSASRTSAAAIGCE